MAVEVVRHGDIELGEMLRILWQRRWLLAAIVTGVTLAGALAGQLLPATYTATALVLIEPARDPGGAVTPGGLTPAVDGGVVESHVRVIGSRSLAERVVARLDHEAIAELVPPPTGPVGAALAWTREASGSAGGDAVAELLERLTVARDGKSQVIAVTWRSADPERAAMVANAVAETYIAHQLEAKRAAATAATAQLRDQLAALEQAATVAARRAADAREGALRADRLPDQAALARLAELERAVGNARLEVEAKTARVAAAWSGGTPPAGERSGVVEVLRDLKGEQAALLRREAELKSTFGERHPRLLEVRAEQDAIARRIAAEETRLVRDGQIELEVARQGLASLEQQLELERTRAIESTRAESTRRELAEEASQARERVKQERERLAEMQARIERQQPDARLISPASVPTSPVFPKPRLFLSVAFTASLAIGLFTVWALESASAGVRDSRALEAAIGLPVLSAVPQLRRGPVATPPHEQVVERPMSRYAESLREILFALRAQAEATGARIVLVSSAVPGEGKTALTLALGRLAAQEGLRTRVVDADLRRPSVVQRLGVPGGAGLLELLAGEARPEEVIRGDARTALSVVGAGSRTISSLRPYGRERLRMALATLAQDQDLVLVDTAPVLAVADTRLLAQAVDASLLVVRHLHTAAETAARAAHELAETGTPLLGGILSIVDLARVGKGALAGREAAYAGRSDYYSD